MAAVGLQAADALAHAHHQGVIHRDVKPSNLLIDAKGNIWVTDFGLARRLADPGLTHHDSLLGTPRYMSPEQARTAGNIDGRTDVYSLGATLYELLTLRPPFDGQSAAELIDQIGRDDPVPPRKFEPRVPRDLETIVLKALAKRPTDRYATAAELAEDLARFLSHAPVKARRIGPVGRLWRVARRHPGISIVTTAAAATILAIATYAHVRVLDSRARVIQALATATEKGDALEVEIGKNEAVMRKQFLQTAQILESSDKPDRRGQGLDLIAEAVKLRLSPGQRADFRDEAVKFLVLRDVVTKDPLATGHGNGLIFGPQGHRLWVLSEDNESLSLWDVEKDRQLMTLPLRGGSSPAAVEPEPAAGALGAEPGAGQGAGASTATTAGEGRPRARNGPPMGPLRSPGRSVAMAGNYLAVLLPEDNGVTLIDAISGAPLRKLTSPGHSVLGVIADPAGRWLLTTELTLESQPTDEKPPPAAGGGNAAAALRVPGELLGHGPARSSRQPGAGSRADGRSVLQGFAPAASGPAADGGALAAAGRHQPRRQDDRRRSRLRRSLRSLQRLLRAALLGPGRPASTAPVDQQPDRCDGPGAGAEWPDGGRRTRPAGAALRHGLRGQPRGSRDELPGAEPGLALAIQPPGNAGPGPAGRADRALGSGGPEPRGRAARLGPIQRPGVLARRAGRWRRWDAGGRRRSGPSRIRRCGRN